MPSDLDIHYMKAAIAMARRSVGKTAENPAVGCVVVNAHGQVLARGSTQDGGRPHAEVDALAKAGILARGATLYVTFEPCTHHGRTPPCVDAIVDAGIKRVVIGACDPDPRVDGRARGILESHGIEVEQDVLESDCLEVVRGFIMRQTQNRPFVTLKAACTLDGKIAAQGGDSQWITSDLARKHVHLKRSCSDAILVGVETVLADDPLLTARLDVRDGGLVRVVLDSNLRLGVDAQLCQTARDCPLIVFYKQAPDDKVNALRKTGAEVIQVDPKKIQDVLRMLADRGVNSLLVEGGAAVHASFLSSGFCDELMVYRAGKIIGAEGVSSIGDLNLAKMAQSYNFRRVNTLQLGEDLLETYTPLAKEG